MGLKVMMAPKCTTMQNSEGSNWNVWVTKRDSHSFIGVELSDVHFGRPVVPCDDRPEALP